MSELPTQCQCENPGFCQLLRRVQDPHEGRKMSPVRHEECQHKPHYFEMFLGESVAGGRTELPKKPSVIYRHKGLGDTVAAVISWFGYKPKKGCGCKKRRSWLNALVPYDWLRVIHAYFRR